MAWSIVLQGANAFFLVPAVGGISLVGNPPTIASPQAARQPLVGSLSIAGSAPTLSNGSSFATTFSGSENPISQGGKWENLGLDWTNVAVVAGVAQSTQVSNTYDDSFAVVKSSFIAFSNNQQAEGTIFLDPAYSPSGSHEAEIWLRASDSPHNASCYECNLAWDGSYSQVVRWNGAFSSFSDITSTSNPIKPQTGDILRAKIVGTVISVYLVRAGVANLITSATDSTLISGQPGMAFFIRPGATAAKYGFTAFSAKGLP